MPQPVSIFQREQFTPEQEIGRALELLAFYRAPVGLSLWHSIEHVVNARQTEIVRLETENGLLRERIELLSVL